MFAAFLPWAAPLTAAEPLRPVLVDLVPRSLGDAPDPAFQTLLDADGLLDLRVEGRVLAEDRPPGRGSGAQLRRLAGLGPATQVPRAWVLLGPEGQVAGSGPALPGPEEITAALTAAGVRNPVVELTAFLGDHPGHDEARRDLLLALRPRLQGRLGALPPTPGHDLEPEQDARVWGAVAPQLDLLLRTEAWAGLDLRLGPGCLPPGVPERRSPLMKAVYRRHRPQLIAALQRYPALGTGWHNLLRMAEALGEASITGVVAGTDWSLVSPVDAAMVPYQDLAACVLAEARATGAWPQAKAALQELWTRLAQPKLTQFAKADLGPPGADPGESRRLALAEREDLWDHLLAPLLEAMVRSGGEGEVPGLLMGLDQSWDALGPRLRAEARALGRPGLAPAWVAATRALSPRLPREGLIGQDLVLIYLGQPPGAHDAFTLGFLKEGLALQPQPATAAWVRRLGWEGAGPRWALVDGGGEVLLKGERLPGAPALLTTFRALGRSTAMARVQTLLKAHPGHLGGLAIRARLLDGIAWAHWNERHGQERPVPDMGEAEAGAWRGLLGDLDRMLDDPLALSPYPLMRAGLHVPQRGWWSGDLEGAAEALARRALPLVEAALARRPSDLELWRMWLTWAPWQERELLPLLEGLAPSPLAAPGAFPPRAVLIEATRCLAAQERWGRVVELLQHRTNRSPGLTLSLLEALLHLGRTLEVDAILADLDRVGAPLAAHDLTALCRLGETLGETAWVRRWTPVRPGAASGR